MRVAHFNSLLLKASGSSFTATARSGFSNAPMRPTPAEDAENRPQLPDWAKSIIQHPQRARIDRVHKGLNHRPLTPADLGLILLATVAAVGVVIASLALGGAPGVDPHLTMAIFAAP
jgi:hypothetical protein